MEWIKESLDISENMLGGALITLTVIYTFKFIFWATGRLDELTSRKRR